MAKHAIVNVVDTASLGQKLDFYKLTTVKEIVYDANVYRGRVAYFKQPTMEGRVSLFPSGKMISGGTKSEKKAHGELEKATKFLAKKGLVKEVGLHAKTQNTVVTAVFEGDVNLTIR